MQQAEDCIREGADIFGRDLHNACCLHFSAKAPNANAIQFAFEQGLSINSKDNDDQTALHVAAKFNRLETVKYLVEVKHFLINDRDMKGKTPLYTAVENDCREVVEFLLRHGANTLIKDAQGHISCYIQQLSLNLLMWLKFFWKKKQMLMQIYPLWLHISSRSCRSRRSHISKHFNRKKADVNFKTEFVKHLWFLSPERPFGSS
ncbi:ankyrin repeat protein RF_0381 [Caerostris extrusa]|uniref:Ankyrin repeat protein RF_0381 n=1 Tax=Caerostris extrusa TaxID=172846 RepID=A0AAV4U3C3_CAEEX|nr:ankyrin repeat protein RF_0381 [Caerostris extrusa]